jgi:hypothetical protein
LIRDAAILLALAFVCYRIYEDGAQSVKSQDMTAVVAEIKSNAAKEDAWRLQSDQANAQRSKEISDLKANIDANKRPVIIVQPPAQSPGPDKLPVAAASTGTADTASGQVDIRPGINAFEDYYETALANCRDAIASWPQ